MVITNKLKFDKNYIFKKMIRIFDLSSKLIKFNQCIRYQTLNKYVEDVEAVKFLQKCL